MAKERWFTGFEDANGYDLSSFSGGIIADSTARTGDFFLSHYCPITQTQQARRALVNTYTCASNGDRVVARMQYAFRVRQLPAVTINLGGFSIGTTIAPNADCRVQITSTGSIIVAPMASNSGVTATVSMVPQLGKWYVLRLHFTYQRNDSGADPYTGTVWVYDGDTMEQLVPGLVGTATASGALAASFALNGVPCLGANITSVRIIDYDDWWLSVADGADVGTTDLNFPRGSRIQAVPITSQVIGGFTGNFLLARDIPNSAVAGNEQTTATPGATSTFQHQTAVELGLIPLGQEGGPGSGDPDAPPFNGLPVPDGFSSTGLVHFGIPQDMSLPTPSISSFTLTAGAGQYNSGVWIRAFTIKYRNVGGSSTFVGGPMTAPVFLSAAAAPNFAANIQTMFNPATPADAFDNPAIPGAYNRWGIGLLITNASNGRGLLNPFTDQLNLAGTQTNTTEMNTYGGPGAIDAGPWGSLVALVGDILPNGVTPPYANTNPQIRPTTLTFLLSSPRPTTTGGSSQTTTNMFGAIFQPPSAVADPDLPICEALKVVCAYQLSAGASNNDILIDGVATSVACQTTFGGIVNQMFALDWTERDDVAFDAMTFGGRAGAGLASTLRLGSCVCEVMTAGPCTRRTTGPGQYQQQCGIYTSNNGFQTIPVGFKPTLVFVKRIAATATPGAMKAWWMGGTQSWLINTITPESNSILELTDIGFLVGPNNSSNGVAATYAYMACRDGQEDTVNDAYMVTGSYQRAATTDPDQVVELLLPLNFAASWVPDVVYVPTNSTVLKTPDMASPNSLQFSATGLSTTNLTALGDRTFTTGTALSGPGQSPYFAYKFDGGGLLATLFQYGMFAGSGGVQVIPTAFQAEILVLDHPAAAYAGRWRSFLGNTGNNSVPWIGGAVTTTDITAIGALDFTVGAGASVVGQISYWTAWKRDGSIGNSGSSDVEPPGPPDPPVPTDSDLCGGGGMRLPAGSIGAAGCTAC